MKDITRLPARAQGVYPEYCWPGHESSTLAAVARYLTAGDSGGLRLTLAMISAASWRPRRLSVDFALGLGYDAGGRVAEGGVVPGGNVTQQVVGGRQVEAAGVSEDTLSLLDDGARGQGLAEAYGHLR